MKVSVTIPVYNAEATIEEVVSRLLAESTAAGYDIEIICVDDRSRDGSWAKLRALKERHSESLRIVRLARNAGQHNALLCAIGLASGDTIITMDDDLQHPPEEITKLVRAVEGGTDLVIGAYDRKQHVAARNAGGSLIDSVLRMIFRLDRGLQLTSFRAFSRRLARCAVDSSSAYPYITALLLSHASSVANEAVRHEPRRHGTSNYNFLRSARLALNLLLLYSSIPATIISSLCAIVFLGLVGYGSFVFYGTISHGSSVPGWTSTILAVTFLNGLVLLGLAVLTFYISRIYLQISGLRSTFSIERDNE